MAVPSNLDTVALRFSRYIDELREFFRSQRIEFGKPADLVSFADRLEHSMALREDLGSLVRSILYREAEKISAVELFEILALAVAGQKIAESAQDFYEPNRRLFGFVNHALRSQRKAVPEEAEQVAPPARNLAREIEAQSPTTRVLQPTQVPGMPERRNESPAVPLFGAYGGDRNDPSAKDAREEGARRGKSFYFLVIASLLFAAVTFYAGRYGVSRPKALAGRLWPTNQAEPTVAAPVKSAAGCTGGLQSQAEPGALREKLRRVAELRAGKYYDTALAALRDIAAADPGYPGINLKISDLDLQMQRTQQARDAVSAQIAISECLSALSPAALDTYCKLEDPMDTTDGCHARLGQLRAAAQLQAAVVVQELSRNLAAVSPVRRTGATRVAKTAGLNADHSRKGTGRSPDAER